MNHKENCPKEKFVYSGEGYNRVRVCMHYGCMAEDHDPEPGSFNAKRIAREFLDREKKEEE